MSFQRLPAASTVLPVGRDETVPSPVRPSKTDPDDPACALAGASFGHNHRRRVKRRTSVTLHIELHEDGEIHVHSPDIPYLILSDHNPRALIADISGALSYEIRRRFSD